MTNAKLTNKKKLFTFLVYFLEDTCCSLSFDEEVVVPQPCLMTIKSKTKTFKKQPIFKIL